MLSSRRHIINVEYSRRHGHSIRMKNSRYNLQLPSRIRSRCFLFSRESFSRQGDETLLFVNFRGKYLEEENERTYCLEGYKVYKRIIRFWKNLQVESLLKDAKKKYHFRKIVFIPPATLQVSKLFFQIRVAYLYPSRAE